MADGGSGLFHPVYLKSPNKASLLQLHRERRLPGRVTSPTRLRHDPEGSDLVVPMMLPPVTLQQQPLHLPSTLNARPEIYEEERPPQESLRQTYAVD